MLKTQEDSTHQPSKKDNNPIYEICGGPLHTSRIKVPL